MFKLVLFDFDGTTLDSDRMLIATFFDLYKKYYPERNYTIEHILTFSGPPMALTLKQEFPDVPFEEIMGEYMRISTYYYPLTIKLYDGVEDILLELKRRGIKTGLITSKSKEMTNYVFDLFSLHGYFDYVLCADEVKNTKPDPEGIYLAMEHFNIINKEDVLYIGDSKYDYLASKNAGIKFALVDWSPRKDELVDKCDYLITSFDNFFKEVEDEKN